MSAQDSPFGLPLAATVWLVQMIAYHGIGLGFESLDRTGRLAAFKTRPVDAWTYPQVLPRVLFNQVFILLPAMLATQALGLAFVGAADIGVVQVGLALAVMTVGHDVVQYVAHAWILHRPALMRSLGHSVHHTTNASRSISACFMSPADFALEIVCPYLLPLIAVTALGLVGANVGFHLFAVVAGAFGGLYEHSGYDFSLRLTSDNSSGLRGGLKRFLGARLSSRAHAEHHGRGAVSFSDGFGSSNICDTVFGTRWDLVAARQRRRPPSAGGQGA